ncbi:hypothetical protein JQ543_13660 [Bradyrhizobium diazoefficiens]|nr:hypothetical protein [Bradyrhizobium diazoefficiens]MBR0848794.1 hypothetical protein [Bradyrhizobium diazoefficiens]
MKYQLAKLRERHQTAPPIVNRIPFTAAADGPMVLTGLAATNHVDLDRQRLRPYALAWLPWKMPPLLYRHDERQVAGRIDHLEYVGGDLHITATVDHSIARRASCFSVGVTVHAFELVDPDSPDFHAIILQGWLDEVSLTDAPANPRAVVMHRRTALPDITPITERLSRISNLMKEVMR